MIVSAAIPVGLVAGMLAWFVAGSSSSATERLDALNSDASRLRFNQRPASSRVSLRAVDLAATPVFTLTTGKGAVTEPALRLDGLTRAPNRIAALLSIDGAAAEWLKVGDSRNGVTLREVGVSRVLVETVVGTHELGVGEAIGGAKTADAAVGAQAGADASKMDKIAPGFRSPPEPASAPTAPR